MAAKTRTVKTTLHRCECSNWDFGQWTGEVPEGADPGDYYETSGTGCQAMTNRTFAQGHDAKLVGFMVRAELGGLDINRNSGGVRHSFGGAVHAAQSISDALAAKAQGQMDAARARLAKKAVSRLTRKVTKAEIAEAKAATKEPEPQLVKAKVGRWTYEGTIGPVTRDFVYRNKLGQMKTAPEGKYTVL